MVRSRKFPRLCVYVGFLALAVAAQAQTNLQRSLMIEERATLTRSQEALSTGNRQLEAGRPEDAIATFQSGIDLIGSAYEAPGLIDDTRAKLIMAEHARRNKNFNQAATLFSRVLEARVQEYERRLQVNR